MKHAIASRTACVVLALVLGALVFGVGVASANHIPYSVGEVFAGVGNGKINRYTQTGLFVEQLDTTSGSREQTGMCFDGATLTANLRSTNFTNNSMTRFNNSGGVVTYPWGSGFDQRPESCLVAGNGHVFVGQADGTMDILEFDAAGMPVANYDVATGSRGSDWIDLQANQCKMLYTSEGNDIYQFDVCAGTQDPFFAEDFTGPGASTVCYALRIRANGEVLVACEDQVYRLSDTGVVLQTYPKATTETSTLFALNLDPDGNHFWTGAYETKNVYKYNIATGIIVFEFSATTQPPEAGAQGETLAGLAIFGEPVVSLPPSPTTLTLEPKAKTNPVGSEHCVTATVTDAAGNPVPNVTVRFQVNGAVSTSGSATTDANGKAQFCYLGPKTPGADVITAYADTNNNNVQDPGEPGDVASKTWVPGAPATLTLEPKAATNPVGTQHCVTATVRDVFGNPVPDVTVRFNVTGSVTTSGSAVTNARGQAQFCYTGPALPGADVITAYADTNNNKVQDPGEPGDRATKTWVAPASTEGCKVTYGGRITTVNGDKATFGGNAQAPNKGQEEYQDHGPKQPRNVHSINVMSVVCSRDKTQASIFGQATIDGAGSFNYRIDVKDLDEPGKTDTYHIRLSDGYDSGEQTLQGGNVQIHK